MIGALLSMAAPMIGQMLGGGGGSSGGGAYVTSPYDQMKNTSYGQQSQQLAGQNASYLSGLYNNLNNGQAPQWATNYADQANPYQQTLNKRRFLGQAGDRGGSVMGQTLQNSAMFGLNPKANAAQMSKVSRDYANTSQGIDQYFNDLKFSATKDAANNLPGWANAQQNANTSMFQPSVTPYAGSQNSSGNWAGLASGLMGAMGGENGIGTWLGNRTQGAGNYAALGGLGQAAGQIGNYVGGISPSAATPYYSGSVTIPGQGSVNMVRSQYP